VISGDPSPDAITLWTGSTFAARRWRTCTLRRVDTVKRRSRTALPARRFTYKIGRGQPSLLD
jgi:hypothetical protein